MKKITVATAAVAAVAGPLVALGLSTGMAHADNTNNPSTKDSQGFGVTNVIHNMDDGHNGIGVYRSDQSQPDPNTVKDVCGSACVDLQGNPDAPGYNGPISNKGGNKDFLNGNKVEPQTKAKP
jgi:hypothetical protein